MPKQTKRKVVKKKPLVKITINTPSKKRTPIIKTKKGIKVIPRNNTIKKKSENWLQKTKLISSLLETASFAHPIAKFGLNFARSQGYGRKRGGAIHRNIISNTIPTSKKPSWGSRIKTTASKYGKYAIPLVMAGVLASRGTRHHEIPYAGESLRAQYERF